MADGYRIGVDSDRRFHPPYGIEGGEAGAPSSNTIRLADGERAVAPMPNGVVIVGGQVDEQATAAARA